MFSVGDKVICINDDFTNLLQDLIKKGYPTTFLNLPVKDKVYTVRAVFSNNDIVCSILLEELSNPSFYIPLLHISRELSFAAFRFVKTLESYQESVIENTLLQ